MSLNMQPRPYSPTKYQSKIKSQVSNDPLQQSTVKKMHPFSQSNQQSPYTHSPNVKVNYSLAQSNDELDLYRQKCYDLEHENQLLRKDVDLQRFNTMKTTELENKTSELIDQNQVLSGQVDRANKLALQKKTEADMWKQKYETQMNQLIQIKANYETEIRQLSSEVQRVNARLGGLEADKNRQISDSKAVTESQKNQHLDTFKNSNQQQAEMYENQLKKMRDIIEDKTILANQLQTQLERLRAEASDQQSRLRNDIESLKNRISSLQIDHQAELLALKNKLDLYKDTQVKNVQYAHDNQTDILINEINKLKHLLDIKNEEIETLIQQNQKQKNSFDLELSDLRFENDELKQKLLDNESIHQQENHNIQTNLETMHNNELTSLKMQQEQQLLAINNENLKLKEIIDSKNAEIEKQIIEKAQQKDYYDAEINRLIGTIEDYKRKLALQQAERNREVSDLLSRIDRLNEQSDLMRQDMQKQIDLLDQELNNLKAHLADKNKQLESQMTVASKQKLDFEEKIHQLNDEIELLKLKSFELEKAKMQEIQDLKLILKEQESQLKERIKQLEISIEHLKYELTKAIDMFNNKSRECENLIIQRGNSDQQAKKLSDENDRLIQKLNQFEKEKNLEVDALRQNMDQGAAYQFENLKSAYNTQVGILSDQIADLQNQLNLKNKEYNELLEKYAILDKAVIPEPLVRQNMYNSRTGVPAEYITNKSIHEVLVRSQLRQTK